MNALREELKSVKDELIDAKEELKEIKIAIHIERTEQNQMAKNIQEGGSEREFKCKACDKTFNSKKLLKGHIKATHSREVKCKSCEETFEMNSDLEVHIKTNHEPNGKYKCDTCGKTFALRWRLKKHQESHASLKARKCHYFNNEKDCPFEEIGCMFDHTLSKMCSYGQRCSQKLCSYQHGAYNSTNNTDSKENLETLINESHTTEESVQDEEYFDLYVEHNLSEVYERFITDKRQIHCYFCKYVFKSKTMVNIQEEVNVHLKTYHSEIIEKYDPDNFDSESDYHQDFLDFFVL